MRDVLLMSIIMPWALFALRHPWIGVLLWVWVSLMNPHRYTFGFAHTAPVAMIAALVTLIGLLGTKHKSSPFKAAPVTWIALLVVWITISWLMGMNTAGQFGQWDKVMKVYLMVFVTLMLVHRKLQIVLLVWVMTLSVALLSTKGGVFTIATGGSHRVWGAPGSWTYGNNEFAVATIMAIPLLRFLQMQVRSRLLSLVLTAMMLLSAASALGSHSRGALLGIAAMTAVFWWRGQNKVRNGLFLSVLAVAMVAAMPDNWSQRMDTIQTYDTDLSAIGRLSAWSVGWGIAKNHLFGVGFDATYPELFQAYSPYWPLVGEPVAHSIWFQMMGHHGMIGFVLFVGVWVSTWFVAARLRRAARQHPEAKWAGDLGAMCQVCLVGYCAGGSFLQLAYYDFPYYVVVIVVAAYAWVQKQAWQTEQQSPSRWVKLIGAGPDSSLAGESSSAASSQVGQGWQRVPGNPGSAPK